MGLDSYFRTKNANDEGLGLTSDDRLKKISLCGGFFSGDGTDGSFRGKVYDYIFDDLTDGCFSLYVEQQTPDDYILGKEALEDWLAENPDRPYDERTSRQEIEDLLTLFTVAHEQGADLFGWW